MWAASGAVEVFAQIHERSEAAEDALFQVVGEAAIADDAGKKQRGLVNVSGHLGAPLGGHPG